MGVFDEKNRKCQKFLKNPKMTHRGFFETGNDTKRGFWGSEKQAKMARFSGNDTYEGFSRNCKSKNLKIKRFLEK